MGCTISDLSGTAAIYSERDVGIGNTRQRKHYLQRCMIVTVNGNDKNANIVRQNRMRYVSISNTQVP